MHRSQCAPQSAPNRCYQNQQAHHARILRIYHAPKPVCPAKCAKQMLSESSGSSFKNVAYMSCTEASVPRKVHQTDAIRINRLIMQEYCVYIMHRSQCAPQSAPNRCYHNQQAHHSRMLHLWCFYARHTAFGTRRWPRHKLPLWPSTVCSDFVVIYVMYLNQYMYKVGPSR